MEGALAQGMFMVRENNFSPQTKRNENDCSGLSKVRFSIQFKIIQLTIQNEFVSKFSPLCRTMKFQIVWSMQFKHYDRQCFTILYPLEMKSCITKTFRNSCSCEYYSEILYSTYDKDSRNRFIRVQVL